MRQHHLALIEALVVRHRCQSVSERVLRLDATFHVVLVHFVLKWAIHLLPAVWIEHVRLDARVEILLLIKRIVDLRTGCARNLLAYRLRLLVEVECLFELGLLLIWPFVRRPLLIVTMVVLDLKLDHALVDRRCSFVLPFDIDDLMLAGAFIGRCSGGLGDLRRQLPARLRLAATNESILAFALLLLLPEDALVEDLLDILQQRLRLQLLVDGAALFALPVLVVLLRVRLDLLLVLSNAVRYLDGAISGFDAIVIGGKLQPDLIGGYMPPIRIFGRVNIRPWP